MVKLSLTTCHARRIATPYRAGFLRRSRNLYDRYVDAVKPWARQLWYDWLAIRPGMRVVDVGCGTGHFTRFLARGLKGRGHVLGLDKREVLVKTAVKETSWQGLGGMVEYRSGDALNLPVPDDYADLVACRTLLMHLKDPLAAIREMCRVTKHRGLVAAVETDFRMRCYYSPKGDKRNRLARVFSEAWLKGLYTLDGKDYSIGSKLPSLFATAGLSSIQANLDADPWLYCDPRRPLRDKQAELRSSLEGLRHFEETSRYLRAGGMSNRDIQAYHKTATEELRSLARNPKRLVTDTTFYGACWFVITGRKPRLGC